MELQLGRVINSQDNLKCCLEPSERNEESIIEVAMWLGEKRAQNGGRG